MELRPYENGGAQLYMNRGIGITGFPIRLGARPEIIDAWGNLTNRTVTKCSADPLSVAVLTNNRLSGFGYDAAGNMTSNGGASYSYDGESRLKTTAGVTYTYDGDGNRVKKSNGTMYWGALAESDLSGNLQREFIFCGRKTHCPS